MVDPCRHGVVGRGDLERGGRCERPTIIDRPPSRISPAETCRTRTASSPIASMRRSPVDAVEASGGGGNGRAGHGSAMLVVSNRTPAPPTSSTRARATTRRSTEPRSRPRGATSAAGGREALEEV
jgi:hypothetical protein